MAARCRRSSVAVRILSDKTEIIVGYIFRYTQEWRGGGTRRGDQPELQQWYWGERFDVRGHSNRRRRHGWRRRFHESRLSSPDHRFRLLFDVALGDRRHRGILRGDLLRRTRRDVSALERRIQFSAAYISSGIRISRRLAIGDSRVCSTGRACGDGLWGIRKTPFPRQIPPAPRS